MSFEDESSDFFAAQFEEERLKAEFGAAMAEVYAMLERAAAGRIADPDPEEEARRRQELYQRLMDSEITDPPLHPVSARVSVDVRAANEVTVVVLLASLKIQAQRNGTYPLLDQRMSKGMLAQARINGFDSGWSVAIGWLTGHELDLQRPEDEAIYWEEFHRVLFPKEDQLDTAVMQIVVPNPIDNTSLVDYDQVTTASLIRGVIREAKNSPQRQPDAEALIHDLVRQGRIDTEQASKLVDLLRSIP